MVRVEALPPLIGCFPRGAGPEGRCTLPIMAGAGLLPLLLLLLAAGGAAGRAENGVP